jgi:hypothetical protein
MPVDDENIPPSNVSRRQREADDHNSLQLGPRKKPHVSFPPSAKILIMLT